MLRYDVTTNDWVIFSPARAMRPEEFSRRIPSDEQSAAAGYRCPFCPGNEDLTAPEITAIRDGGSANKPGWKVRVVPNKHPALRIEENHQRHEDGRLFRQMGGCGAHEVIIDSPDHNASLALLPVEQTVLILRTLRDRYNDLMRDPRFQTIVIFKNHGPAAGNLAGSSALPVGCHAGHAAGPPAKAGNRRTVFRRDGRMSLLRAPGPGTGRREAGLGAERSLCGRAAVCVPRSL